MTAKRTKESVLVPIFLSILGLGLCVGAAIVWRRTSPAASLGKVSQLLNSGRVDEALPLLRTVLKKDPANDQALFLLADAVPQMDLREAQALIDASPADLPGTRAAYDKLVLAAVNRKDDGVAIQLLDHLTTRYPDDDELAFRFVRYLGAIGQNLQAKKRVEDFLSRHPRSVKLHQIAAEVYDQLDDGEGVLRHMTAILEIDPDDYNAHLNLAHAHNKAGDLQAADEMAQWCLEKTPKEPKALYVAANVARSKGDSEQAMQIVDRLLAVKPDDVDALLLRCRLLQWARANDEAIKVLRDLQKDAPRRPEVLALLATNLQATGNSEEARKVRAEHAQLMQKRRELARLRTQVRDAPNDVDARMRLAEAYHELRMDPEALVQVNLLLRNVPKHGAALKLRDQLVTAAQQ